MDGPYTEQLASSLSEALGACSVKVEREGDAMVLSGTDMRLSAVLGASQMHGERATLRLDVRFQLGPGRVVCESYTGEGESLPAAIGNAADLFAGSALPVLLAAVMRTPDARVRHEHWTSGSHSFRVSVGAAHDRVAPAAVGAPGGSASLLSELKATIAGTSLAQRTHWVHVSSVRASMSADPAVDVRLDNEPWPELASRLSSWSSLASADPVRLFLVLDVGFDTSRAVAALYRLRDRPDTEIVRALVAQGATAAHAEKLVDFVPIAFGRPVLERMGVRASEQGVFVVGGVERAFRLLDDPLFADASALAREAYAHGTVPGDLFQSIAMRGAELAAVSDAISNGASTRNLALSPPRFTTTSSLS